MSALHDIIYDAIKESLSSGSTVNGSGLARRIANAVERHPMLGLLTMSHDGSVTPYSLSLANDPDVAVILLSLLPLGSRVEVLRNTLLDIEEGETGERTGDRAFTANDLAERSGTALADKERVEELVRTLIPEIDNMNPTVAKSWRERAAGAISANWKKVDPA